MKYTVLSLFPEIVDAFVNSSIMAKAIGRGLLEYQSVNIRDFAFDKHRTCDDAPYGGGAGMLMLAEPLSRALESVGVWSRLEGQRAAQGETVAEAQPVADCGQEQADTAAIPPVTELPPVESPRKRSLHKRVIYLTPSGRPFTQAVAGDLAAEAELVLLCGRYEGIDQRIIDAYVDDEVSIGDYVLSSGEAAAIVVIDATYRLVEQVISADSLAEESFSGGLLEYPQWTRPEIYGMLKVPDILLSGHHENIRRWRLRKRVEKTFAIRPDLIGFGEENGLFDEETCKIIEAVKSEGGDDERDKGH